MLFYTKKPKFEFENNFLKLCYQSYLIALKSFYRAEKATIAYAYLVLSILKQRINNAFNLVAYNCIKDHAILFAQNLALLLNLFLPLSRNLHNVICII